MSSEKQKAINNRRLFFAGFLVVVAAVGIGNVMNLEEIPPWEKDTIGWYVFFYLAGLVLAFSMILHLFYFSWLSAAPVQRPLLTSAVPLKQLLLPAVAVHLLVIIPANISFVFVALWQIEGFYVGLGLLLSHGLLFCGGEMFLLGTRWFAPVFSGCHFGWRLPVLILSGAAAWAFGMAGYMGFIAAGGI